MMLPPRFTPVTERIGFFALWLFALGAFLSTAAATAGYILLAATFLTGNREWRRILRDPLLLAVAGLALFAALDAWWMSGVIPAAAEDLAGAAGAWAKLLLFIPFGWWLARRPAWRDPLLLAALIGLSIGMLREADWANLSQFLVQRSGYQLPAIGLGMVTGIALIGLLTLGWRSPDEPGGRGCYGGLWLIVGLLLLMIMLQGLIQSYSRGSWLALLVALVAIGLFWLRGNTPRRPLPSLRQSGIALLLLVALLGLFWQLYGERIGQRVVAEQGVIDGVMAGDLQGQRVSSISLRLNAWLFGLEQLAERPLTGWGPGSTRYLIDSKRPAGLQNPDGSWLPHLHNTYIDVAVQLGLVGLLWTLLIIGLLVVSARRSCGSGLLDRRHALFLVGVLVLIAVWALFNYRVIHRDWRFSWIMLAGLVYSYQLQGWWASKDV